MIKVYIDTYGCSANQNDSEIMAGLLEKADFILVDTVENADVIIVNTCIVKEPTHNKMNHLLENTKVNFLIKK